MGRCVDACLSVCPSDILDCWQQAQSPESMGIVSCQQKEERPLCSGALVCYTNCGGSSYGNRPDSANCF